MAKLFYLKKIVRDDKKTLEFDRHEIFLAEDNSLLTRPEIQTSSVEYTEADGGEVVAQRLTIGEQAINGLIVPKENDYWTLRNRLTEFFQINRSYFLVYEKISGEEIVAGAKFKTGNAWISENLQVPPEPKEDYSEFSITFGIGVAGFQEYIEDPSGEETFAHSIEVGLATSSMGGQVWDETGQVYDTIGSVWAEGGGGLQEIYVDSTTSIYPVVVIKGSAVNPSIRNNTNDTVATYEGGIGDGQTLTIDFSDGTASLDGANVTRNLKGELRLEAGTNLIGFDIASGNTKTLTLKWNNFIQ